MEIKTIKDSFQIRDKISMISDKGGPKGTRIIFYDKDGKPYKETTNTQVIAGGQLTAVRQFGLKELIKLPNYNVELGIEDDVSGDQNDTCCLWLAGTSGCGTKQDDIYPVTFGSRIPPESVVPFQYRKLEDDLKDTDRDIYFGRKIDKEKNRVAYYYKAFNTNPQLKMQLADGTQIGSDIYNLATSVRAQCYVEVQLKITADDFRDWYLVNDTIGNCHINTLSLLTAHRVTRSDGFTYFENVKPLTQTNFSNDWYNDLTKSSLILYQIFY